MFTDYILNGEGHGEVASAMGQTRFDPGLMRPYFNRNGDPSVTWNTGRMTWNSDLKQMVPVYREDRISDLMNRGLHSPVFNATTLRKDEWIMLDQAVLRAARERLRAWSDLSAKNSFGGFNGMSRMILEHETMSDPGQTFVDMDGLSEGTVDAPKFQLEGLPLPITHSSFNYSKRRLTVSRNGNTPLDTVSAEAAGRRVAETIEQTLIGTVTGLTYGLSTDYSRTASVYGYTNYPDRITKTDLTTPTGSNPASTLADVLSMRDSLYDAKMYGPYMLYHSTDWDEFMDNDYYVTSTGAPYVTLRQRLKNIEGIQDVRRLDFLTSTFTLIMVQMTSDVCRAVNGMDISTIQWESMGGMRINFKVMAIQVPQLRSDFDGNCGILHATTA